MSTDKSSKDSISFREFLSVQKWLFTLFYKEAPVLTSVQTVMVALKELEGLISAFLFGYILDRIISVATSGGSINEILMPLFLLFGLRIFFSLIQEVKNYTSNLINYKSNYFLESVIYTKIASLSIESLENPEINNLITRATRNIHNLPYFLDSSIRVIGRLISAIVSGITLATFFPELIPILMIVAIPRMYIETKYLHKIWKLDYSSTEKSRKAFWSSGMLKQVNTIGEVRTTGIFSFFDKAFRGFADEYMGNVTKIFNSWYSLGFIFSIFSTVAIFGGYYLLLDRLVLGVITVGTFTFQIRAIDIFFSDFFWGVFDVFNLRQRAIRFKDSKELFDLKSEFKDGEKSLDIAYSTPEMKFDNVSFSYPNADKKVLSNFNLTIKPGEKVAIVGKNGAGKTTTVKLLSRFYRVTEGELLINGININDLNSDDWYKGLSIVAQEFNRYGHLSVKENVLVGDINRDENMTEFEEALKSADAHEFVMDYKDKYDQVLSEQFEGGTRPSTGQWQKLALARFFYRNTPVVIFDEPTAAIDAEAEFNIFNRIYDFFKNKTVIIISHRFSTVRNADRILVLSEGKIIEDGSHEELMQLNGEYAKAFRLQAKGYE